MNETLNGTVVPTALSCSQFDEEYVGLLEEIKDFLLSFNGSQASAGAGNFMIGASSLAHQRILRRGIGSLRRTAGPAAKHSLRHGIGGRYKLHSFEAG